MLTDAHNLQTKSKWQQAEVVCAIFVFFYFIFYPRDTVSDFIICSLLCFIILSVGSKVGLNKPKTKPTSALDYSVASLTILSFLGAWLYGYSQEKFNYQSIITSLIITTVYFYYAWIQHFLAQRYVALRMKTFSKQSSLFTNLSNESKAALLTGLIFGIIHIPYPALMLPAAIGGAMYAYYFLTTGRLWIVVSSHALVASSWLFWFQDANAFTEFPFLFNWI
jgi:membrane protease YdiL (CAAX protease family)